MADNYLEKRMEDYRRGGGGRTMVRRKSGGGVRFLIFAEFDGRIETIAERLQKGGCRVAFTDVDNRRGRVFAQRSGCLFIPVGGYDGDAAAFALKTMAERWGGADFIIAGSPACVDVIPAAVADGDAVVLSL